MKILIAAPVYDKSHVIDEYLKALDSLEVPPEHQLDLLLVDNSNNSDFFKQLKDKKLEHIKDFKVKRIMSSYPMSSRERVADCYNIIREHFLARDYDRLFLVEADCIVQPKHLIQLLECINDERQVISGLIIEQDKEGKEYPAMYMYQKLWGVKKYWADTKETLWLLERETIRDLNKYSKNWHGLCPCFSTSCTCLMMTRYVVGNITFRWDINHRNHQDAFFFEDLSKLGLKCWVRVDVVPAHKRNVWRDDPDKEKIAW